MTNIFTVKNGQNMPVIFHIPETHWYLTWDAKNQSYWVKDCCGYISYDLSREAKRILKNWSADAFHAVGFFLQAHTMRLAS